jgi:ketosteroid isomerase-like protein
VFTGSPELTIERLVEEGDAVVYFGKGEALTRAGDKLRFVFSDLFAFRGDRIRLIETYQVNRT